MLADIMRFYRQSRELLTHDDETLTLGEYLRRRRYSEPFIRQHLIPMGAAIWSADPDQFYQFPARAFVGFCHNHGMLNIWRRPQWRVIKGGSWEYAKKLTAPFRDRIRLNTPVVALRRDSLGVEVARATGTAARYDAVVLATHSNQALRMLSDPSDDERSLLGAIPYQPNDVVLHTDESLLPRNRRAWASWNYHIPHEQQRCATMTYNMNLLQSLDTQKTYCVTLNATDRIAPEHILRRFTYDHPVYTVAGMRAQKQHHVINGVKRTFYCGAYWGYGFHEDGVRSALTAIAPLLGPAEVPGEVAA
jgi:predicted NAD/FAD-binding protein